MDDEISNYIINLNKNAFSHVSPNIVTSCGLIATLLLIGHLKNLKQSSLIQISVLILGRWLADTLDGNIARTFNKTSKFGGAFDLMSDNIFAMIIIYFVLKYQFPQFNKIVSLVITCIFVSYFYYMDSLYIHSDIANVKNQNISTDIINFSMQNTLIIYCAIIMYLAYIKYTL